VPTAKYIVRPRYKKGDGIIKSMGWQNDKNNEKIFCISVEFPEGPPDLTSEVIWNGIPVKIIPIENN